MAVADARPATLINPMLTAILQGIALGIPSVATPGPLQAFLLSETVRRGWRRTLPAALAPLISDGPIVLLVLLVLGQTPPRVLEGLRIVGGLFVLYLAWGAYKRRSEALHPARETAATGANRSLLKAALTNILNPNPYFFWSLVAGPVFLAAWRQAAPVGLAFLVGFYATMVLGLGLSILLFAFAGRLDARLHRILVVLSVGLLVAFGLYQLWIGVTAQGALDSVAG